MKSLIKTALFILALQQIQFKANAAFDTASGQYLSEQDLFIVLKSVFTQAGLVEDYDGMFQEINYTPSTFSDHLYEFGFINLESGQPMSQTPGESYILKIDLFVGRAYAQLMSFKTEAFQKTLFSEELNAYFLAKQQEHQQQYNQPINFYGYILYYKFSTLSPQMQDIFVQDILNFVFLEPALVPKLLKESLMKSIVPVLSSKDLTIDAAIKVVLKKAIINDYFLRY